MSDFEVISNYRSKYVIFLSGLFWALPFLLIISLYFGLLSDLRNGEDPMLGWFIHNAKIFIGLIICVFGLKRYSLPVLFSFPKTKHAIRIFEDGILLDDQIVRCDEIEDIVFENSLLNNRILVRMRGGRSRSIYPFMTEDRFHPIELFHKLLSAAKYPRSDLK